ncbi:MAG: DNA double-strand break repair nuclease NurA [Candidatus Aenigmatarchaeota archaeon]
MGDDFLFEWLTTKIKNLEIQKKKISKILRSSTINSSSLVEEGKFKKIDKKLITAIIGGVDSGTSVKYLSGIDIFFIKTVGVIYYLENGKLKRTKYITSKPLIEYSIINYQLSEIDLEIFSNILRQIREVRMAIKLLEENDLNFLFLNGSIIPHYLEFTSRNEIIEKSKEELYKCYQKLYEVSKQKRTILAGIIEDSRGRRFLDIALNIVKNEEDLKTLEESRDITILDYVLESEERTPVFYYSDNIHIPNMKSFQSFYIKVAKFDIPLRVDFLAYENDFADKISNILILLKTSEEYAIPSILIEADLRARLHKTEIENFYNFLIRKLGFISSLKKRRRERRPF